MLFLNFACIESAILFASDADDISKGAYSYFLYDFVFFFDLVLNVPGAHQSHDPINYMAFI